jgi:hypothetical protein
VSEFSTAATVRGLYKIWYAESKSGRQILLRTIFIQKNVFCKNTKVWLKTIVFILRKVDDKSLQPPSFSSVNPFDEYERGV